jgi:exo-beta-1,3-glucanase (GH17 family)
VRLSSFIRTNKKTILHKEKHNMTRFSFARILLWLTILLHEQQQHRAFAVPVQLYGLNYNTRQGPDCAWEKCKYKEQIITDLTLLKRITNRIRILSLTDCGQGIQVLEVAKDLGMQVWLGMWVAEEEYVFEDEKGTLFDLIQSGLISTSNVLGITVGSESIYREEVTSEQIIDYMNQVRGILADGGLSDIPVSITEIAPSYSAYADLRSAVDVVYTNIFPFWEGIPINGAIEDLLEDINWVKNLPESQGKDLIIGETGWPSDGFIEGVGVASPENQVKFFIDFYCEIGERLNWKYYWFTAIDNKWRQEQDPENDVEGNFGFLTEDLTLKSHFQDLTFTCSNGVEYSFSEIDWTIPTVTAAPAVVPMESCKAHSGCSGLNGNCCPTANGIFLGCCDNAFDAPVPTPAPAVPTKNPSPGPTRSPTRFPTFISDATVAPITPPPTIAPSIAPFTASPTVAPVTPTPTLAPVTAMPTIAPVTATPTVAPVTPPPTIAPFTAAPTIAPFTAAPTVAPVTAAPTAAPATQPPTTTTLSPATSPPTKSPVTAAPTKTSAPIEPSASPSTPIEPIVKTATGLQITLLGMINCDQACQDAFIRQLVLHTEEYFASPSSGIQLLSNTPEIINIDLIMGSDGRKLEEGDSSGVRITYDHTFAFTSDASNVPAAQLAGDPFSTETSRENFVQDLKSDDTALFEDLEDVSDVAFPDTTAPSIAPSTASTRGPSNMTPFNQAPEGDLFSLGTIIGIAVGGTLLLLVCLFCFFMGRRRAKADGQSQGGYEPPGDDLSYGSSSLYTRK